VTIPFIGRKFFQTFYTKRVNAENELGTVQDGYKKGIPFCGMPCEIGLANNKVRSVQNVDTVGNNSGGFHLLKNFCLVHFLFNFDKLSIDLFDVNDLNGRLTFSH
jgi:hypothetical protein